MLTHSKLSRFPAAKLGDFGLARRLQSSLKSIKLRWALQAPHACELFVLPCCSFSRQHSWLVRLLGLGFVAHFNLAAMDTHRLCLHCPLSNIRTSV